MLHERNSTPASPPPKTKATKKFLLWRNNPKTKSKTSIVFP